MRHLAASLVLLTPLLGVAVAVASDRNQPMEISADRTNAMLHDDADSTLIGNVRITQGSLDVQADRAVISRKAGEIVAITLAGNPAVLKQVNPAGEPMTARARQIVYRTDSEVVRLTGAVEIEQPRGTLRGETVNYDLNTGQLDGGGDGSRVQMRILPKAAGG